MSVEFQDMRLLKIGALLGLIDFIEWIKEHLARNYTVSPRPQPLLKATIPKFLLGNSDLY
jgi:hypothetical protein